MANENVNNEDRPEGELIVYQDQGLDQAIQVRLEGENVWLSQRLIADLYNIGVNTVNHHIKEIYSDEELSPEATIRKYRIVQTEGSRQVSRLVDHYNLEMIIAVGFRVRSRRGSQFRKWANERINEYLVKGFTMDDERLKGQSSVADYFDEMLERIRDIRASEKRFYQKVRDLFALSSDYDKTDKSTQMFFAETQNKLLYAVTGKTAAELICDRADHSQLNMGLTNWKGSVVRKGDILVAKNYLNADEIDSLNRLVVIFLEIAELRAKNRQEIKMDFWRENVDQILTTNDFKLLGDKGSVSHKQMESHAQKQYEQFDTRRREQDAQQADDQDMKELEELENIADSLKRGRCVRGGGDSDS